jgi:hypothetical protein
MTAFGWWTPVRTAIAMLALLLPALLLALMTVLSGTAHAHSAVQSVAPAEGATVEDVTEVRVVFNEDVRPEASALVVTGSDGQRHDRGAPVVAGAQVAVAVDAGLPPGDTVVAYRVVSADGHPVSGQYTFTFAPLATVDSPSPGTLEQSPEPSESAAPMPAADSASQPGDSGPSLVPIAVSLVTIPLMALALFLLIRHGLRRHTRLDHTDDEAAGAAPSLPTSRPPDE